MLRLCYCLFLTLLLSGCATNERLGISTEQWKMMSSDMQKSVLAQYKRMEPELQNPRISIVSDGPVLQVSILKGYAMMPPFIQKSAIKQIEFSITPGVCKSVPLRNRNTTSEVKIRACYNGERLSLDPSYYEKDKVNGSVHFGYNPIWRRGFIYNDVTTSGYARLSHASIFIKAIT